MALIRQRYRTDCGVCCLAMLADVSWEYALRALMKTHAMAQSSWSRKYRTTTSDVRRAVSLLGFATTSGDRLRVLPNRLAPRTSDTVHAWELVPDNSLVKIPRRDDGERALVINGDWHWVVKRKGRIYDPGMGVFNLDIYRFRPSSYMNFRRWSG